MNRFVPILFLLIGLAIGTAAWLVLRAKGQHAYDRGKADAEGERIALTERLQARDETIANLNAKVRQLEQKVQEAQIAESNLKAKLAEYATILDQEQKQAEEKLAVVNEAQQRLADAFKALAAEALKSNNQSFLELAKTTLERFQETARGDLERRQHPLCIGHGIEVGGDWSEGDSPCLRSMTLLTMMIRARSPEPKLRPIRSIPYPRWRHPLRRNTVTAYTLLRVNHRVIFW